MLTTLANVEKTQFSTQILSARFKKIKSQILAKSALLSKQGSIIKTWRKHRNIRLGPYFRLIYYENGVRRSIYLGRSEELVQEVRCLLQQIQFRRIARRLRAKIRTSLRCQKMHLKNILRAHGYRMKGFEIHKSKSPI